MYSVDTKISLTEKIDTLSAVGAQEQFGQTEQNYKYPNTLTHGIPLSRIYLMGNPHRHEITYALALFVRTNIGNKMSIDGAT